MIYPASLNITSEIGGTFDATIALFTDQAQTIPLDLTPYTTASLQINKPTSTPQLNITQATGLTLGGVLGTITIALTLAQLAPFTVAQKLPYSLLVSDAGAIHDYFVVDGDWTFDDPLAH